MVVVVVATLMLMERRSRLDGAGDRLAKGRWCAGLVSEANACTILTMLTSGRLSCHAAICMIEFMLGEVHLTEVRIRRTGVHVYIRCLACAVQRTLSRHKKVRGLICLFRHRRHVLDNKETTRRGR